MTTSTDFPDYLKRKGFGTYQRVNGGTFTPGDVVAIDGHVWMVIGMCSDGSVVIVHATPPVIQISGTVTPSGSKNSEAVQLAQAYMKKYFQMRRTNSICVSHQKDISMVSDVSSGIPAN